MTYDLHIEALASGSATGSKVFTFGDYKTPQGVQGIQKLVNRFLKCLCTPKGTDLSDVNYGTILMGMFLTNLDERSVRQSVVTAVHDAEDQVRILDTNTNYPTDERLAGASIESVMVDKTLVGFDATILLTNIAGTTVRLLVPLAYQRTQLTTP